MSASDGRRSRRKWGIAAAGVTSVLICGCAELQVGPPPSTYIGPATEPSRLELGGTTPAASPVPAAPGATTQGEPATRPVTRPSSTSTQGAATMGAAAAGAASQAVAGQGAAIQGAATQPASPLAGEQAVGIPPLPPSVQPAATMPGSTMPASTMAGPSEPSGPPLVLGIEQAILTGLQDNANLAVQRLTPQLQYDAVQQQRAVFDPTLGATLQGGRTGTGPGNGSAGFNGRNINQDTLDASVSGSEFLPTGTTIQPALATSFTSGTGGFPNAAGLYDNWTTSAGLTVTQSLLQGADINANLALLRSAKIDVAISQYQLRGFAETVVGQIEQTYWDYALAQRQIVIFQQSLEVAQQLLDQTNVMIKVGKLADIERAAAEATVAQRRLDLITARSTLEKTRLTLLQLLGGGGPRFLDRPLKLTDAPFVPEAHLGDVRQHVALALRMRPDLNEARLQIEQGNLQVVRTKNGLLPRLDLFITLGKSGFANSFGGSVEDIGGPDYNLSGGLTFSFPPINRSARASYHSALVSRDQQILSLDNITQLAEQDVRTDYINVEQFRASIPAAQAARVAQEASLRAEEEKLRVGRSTTILVAQAQSSLLQAQVQEISAIINYLKSLVTLYQDEGTLLVRRHIGAPGMQPVRLAEHAPGSVPVGFVRPNANQVR